MATPHRHTGNPTIDGPRGVRPGNDAARADRPANALLDAALGYAARGWRIFPVHGIKNGHCTCGAPDCEDPGKHPRISDNLNLATTDPDQIRRWWKKWPDANIGLPTGAVNGNFVLDEDPRNGGNDSLDEFLLEHGPLPETVESQTGGGGRHFLFQHPGRHVASRPLDDDRFPGLDIKGDGGYIILPPSRHVLGRTYEWELSSDPGEVQLASAPIGLIEMVTADSAPTPSPSSGSVIPLGHRNNRLFPLACAMRRHADEPIVIAGLREANKKCQPPYSDSIVVAMAKRVCGRYSPVAMGITNATPTRTEAFLLSRAYILRSQRVPDDLALIYLTNAAKRLAEPVAEELIQEIQHTAHLVDAKEASHYANYYSPKPTGRTAWELEGTDFPDPVWLIPGILPGGLTLLGGRSKIGKSWMGLDIGIGVATGTRVFDNRPTERGGVIYLALEDNDRRLKDRVRKISQGRGTPKELTFFTESPRMNEIGELPSLEEILDSHPNTRLVIIDTLAKIRPSQRPGDRYLQDYFEMQWLQRLAADRGIGILVIHHLNQMREAGDIFDRISGTTGLTGAADTLMVLDRPRKEKDGTLTVAGRDITELSLAMEFDADRCLWVHRGDAVELAKTKGQQEIHEVLKVAKAPLSPTVIAKELNEGREGKPISESSVKNMLKRMLEQGLVFQPGGPGAGYRAAEAT